MTDDIVRVWRVELPCGTGPYCTQGCSRGGGCPYKASWRFDHPRSIEMSNAHSDGEDHPTPYCDGMEEFTHNHVCGVLEWCAVELWFDGFLEELDSLGYVASEYAIEREHLLVGKGGLQVAFVRDKAWKIGQRRLVQV